MCDVETGVGSAEDFKPLQRSVLLYSELAQLVRIAMAGSRYMASNKREEGRSEEGT